MASLGPPSACCLGAAVLTGPDGSFHFDDLVQGVSPNNYSFQVEHAGYVPATGLISRDGKPSNLTLQREATISGRVIDEDGDPIRRMQVRVVKWAEDRGRRYLSPASFANWTQADGTFSIGALSPGTYFVVTSKQLSSTGEYFPETYHPRAPDVLSATAVKLDSGSAASGLAIAVRRTPMYRIAVSLTNSSGFSPAAVRFHPAPDDYSYSGSYSSPAQGNVYESDAMPAGDVRIEAIAGPSKINQTVRIVDRDLRVALTIPVLSHITGRLTVIGELDSKTKIELRGLDNTGSRALNHTTLPDGSFEFDASLGPYQLALLNAPRAAYIQSVTVNGQDFTGRRLSFPADVRMDVTISTRSAELTGVVRDLSGKLVSSGLVMVWRSDPPDSDLLPLVLIATTRGDGTFFLQGLAPGSYRMAAFKSLSIERLGDHQFRDLISRRASFVNVGGGGTVNVTPPYFSAEDIRLLEAAQ